MELVVKGNCVNVDGEQHLDSLEALGEFAHSSVVNRIPLHFYVLLAKDSSVSLNQVRCVLLEDVLYPDIEFFVSFDSVSIVEDRGD